jgi:hypothetical protein
MVKPILTSILVWINLFSFSQINYENEFPISFAASLAYIDTHHEATIRFQNRSIDPALAWSIVFPELIRYDAIQDYFEVGALKTLYIQYGNDYADFSIGHFQMKPSFAEAIQKEWLRKGFQPCPVLDTSESIAARKAIIERLDSYEGQILYLMMFIGIMQERLTNVKNNNEKVLLYSAAYNSSFMYNEATLREISKRSTFHIRSILNPPNKHYCYSDIALYYFKKYRMY